MCLCNNSWTIGSRHAQVSFGPEFGGLDTSDSESDRKHSQPKRMSRCLNLPRPHLPHLKAWRQKQVSFLTRVLVYKCVFGWGSIPWDCCSILEYTMLYLTRFTSSRQASYSYHVLYTKQCVVNYGSLPTRLLCHDKKQSLSSYPVWHNHTSHSLQNHWVSVRLWQTLSQWAHRPRFLWLALAGGIFTG